MRFLQRLRLRDFSAVLLLCLLPLAAAGSDGVDEAYQQQKLALLPQLSLAKPVGFKAGLTAEGAPARFGLERPVHGVLIEAPLEPAQSRDLRLSDYERPMLEMELGFVLAESLDRLPAGPEQLRAAVSAVHPVIEIPDLPAGDLPSGVALIRENVFARHVLVGPALATSTDPNTLRFALQRDGEPVDAGESATVMGDQWRALAWLIARTLEQGWELRAGQLLITGAIGRLNPAAPGSYQLQVDDEVVLEFAFRR